MVRLRVQAWGLLWHATSGLQQIIVVLWSVGFLGIGLSLDSAVSLLLPALIGLRRTSELVFSNKPITAERALQWGLVNRLAPANQLSVQAKKWAEEIAQGPICAMGLAKRNFNKAFLDNLEEVLDCKLPRRKRTGHCP